MRATRSRRPDVGSARRREDSTDYWQADLTDAGAAYAVVRGCDVVVHTAAIPQPIHNPPHVVFGNNMMSTFNVLEAAIAVRRPSASSTSPARPCPGFIFAHRPFEPDYLPIDEEHPMRPQDPYATAKWFGELLCDRAVERADHPLHVASDRAGCRTREATSGTSGRSFATRRY